MTHDADQVDRKEICAGDSKAALTDAIANLLHVIAHEHPDSTEDEIECELGSQLAQSVRSGTRHYVAERDDEFTLVVITE